MPELIESPSTVEAAGTKPKLIEEYVGRVNTGEERLSVARMNSPAGWVEPGQRPEFDEWTLVLEGCLHVEHESGALDVRAGQAVLVRGRRMGALLLARGGRRELRRGLPAGLRARRRCTATMTCDAPVVTIGPRPGNRSQAKAVPAVPQLLPSTSSVSQHADLIGGADTWQPEP